MTRRTGMRPLRIAMIGQKGIPARFGGVETHVENVAERLVERGHHVVAFCRSRFRPRADEMPDGYEVSGGIHRYHGIRLVHRGSINTKHLDAASHTLFCSLEAAWMHQIDIVHFHGIGPSAFAPIPTFFGRKVVSTFHALDWRQVKWGSRARGNLKRGEAIGARWSDGVIAVSRLMEAHVRDAHGVTATYIPNGATLPGPVGSERLETWGLAPDGYVLAVGRVIPDRELHTLINAFNRLDTSLKLVIVGTESPRTDYSDHLESLAGDRVVFTGEVFGEALEQLYANARVYVLASRVEGLPITVCEAMAHGRPCVLSDIPENREVGGDAAVFFKCGDSNELFTSLQQLIQDDARRTELSQRGAERVRTTYNWDVITEQIEAFYYRVMAANS